MYFRRNKTGDYIKFRPVKTQKSAVAVDLDECRTHKDYGSPILKPFYVYEKYDKNFKFSAKLKNLLKNQQIIKKS